MKVKSKRFIGQNASIVSTIFQFEHFSSSTQLCYFLVNAPNLGNMGIEKTE